MTAVYVIVVMVVLVPVRVFSGHDRLLGRAPQWMR